MKLATVGMMMLAASGWGQPAKLPDGLESLGAKAEEKVEVTLDKAMLKFAGGFLSDRGDDAKARKVLGGLESISVRSYAFAREGDYNAADVDRFRALFQSPAWSRVVGVQSRREQENVEVFLKSGANGQLGGAVVIATEAKEVTIVQITGTLDPDHLADLGGQFHIPNLGFLRGVRR